MWRRTEPLGWCSLPSLCAPSSLSLSIPWSVRTRRIIQQLKLSSTQTPAPVTKHQPPSLGDSCDGDMSCPSCARSVVHSLGRRRRGGATSNNRRSSTTRSSRRLRFCGLERSSQTSSPVRLRVLLGKLESSLMCIRFVFMCSGWVVFCPCIRSKRAAVMKPSAFRYLLFGFA